MVRVGSVSTADLAKRHGLFDVNTEAHDGYKPRPL
jgi:hypothetical protein